MKIETNVDVPKGRTLGVLLVVTFTLAFVGLALYEEPAETPAPATTVSPSPSAS